MTKKGKHLICLAIVLFVLPGLVWAKVSEEEAQKLKNELTPVGAIRAGNEKGTIPAWTGGLTTPPEAYVPGEGSEYVNPFPEDKVLFTITSKNYKQYQDKLTEGQVALFEAYPETFKMPVYKTRRTAAYPEKIYEALFHNAKNAELEEAGNGVKNAVVTSPFPIPKNGLQAIWNHTLRFRCEALSRTYQNINVNRDGSYTLVKMYEDIILFYGLQSEKVKEQRMTMEQINPVNRLMGMTSESEDAEELLGYFKQQVLSPARLAGTALLVRESLNQVKKPRQAWTFNRGQRRVRRAPQIAYDSPGVATDGLTTIDDFDLYSGAPDRYNWTLLGKEEKYIPYNSYKIQSHETTPEKLAMPGHINPDFARYELHRVWKVRADLKEGTRHIYKTRLYYIDEDSWQIAVGQLYDKRDQLWRVPMCMSINFYNIPVQFLALHVQHDLQSRRYLGRYINQQLDWNPDLKLRDFTPASLRRLSR